MAAKFVPKRGALLINILSGIGSRNSQYVLHHVWSLQNCASVNMCYIVCGACTKLCEESCIEAGFFVVQMFLRTFFCAGL